MRLFKNLPAIQSTIFLTLTSAYYLEAASPPYDDSYLAPAGYEEICRMPTDLAVFNVRDYGATGDGTTDDTIAIRNTITAARAVGGGIIFFPAGTYAVEVQSSDDHAPIREPIFRLQSGNFVFLGEGADKSHLVGWMTGHKDPVTNWDDPHDPTGYFKVSRFTMFDLYSNLNPIDRVQFRSLDINGQAGYTGNFRVGGDPSTGDGWDMTHKAIAMYGNKLIDNILIFNCDTHHWRGEVIWGSIDGNVRIINTRVRSSNASAISISGMVLIKNTTVGGAGDDRINNGVENFAFKSGMNNIIEDSSFSGAGNGVVLLGAPGSTARVERCNISNNHYGIMFAEAGSNILIKGNNFTNNSHAMINTILSLYDGLVTGFRDITIEDNTFNNTGSAFINQGQRMPNFVLRNNRVLGCRLLSGFFRPPAWTNFIVDGTVFDDTGIDINYGYSGVAGLWTNTTRPNTNGAHNTGIKFDLFVDCPTAIMSPYTDVYRLGAHTKNTTVQLTMPTSLVNTYPVGFTTTLYGANTWVLQADISWNTFPNDWPLNTTGVPIRLNSEKLFELAITDNSPPSTPTNLTATANSSTAINLTWTHSTDDVTRPKYKIFRDGVEIAMTYNNNYSDQSLSPATQYTYHIIAIDAAGHTSESSGDVSVKTLIPNQGEIAGDGTMQRVIRPQDGTFAEISFSLNEAKHVLITARTINGITIKELANREFPAGINSVMWDGKTDSGEMASSGIHFVLIKPDGEKPRKEKVVLIK